ncbi:MAG: fused response regulator/phosphatase [Gammaproteobacteria bacterium]|nr:fused response regulator/phosphatase [Gammaproteobacteria bacterium]
MPSLTTTDNNTELALIVDDEITNRLILKALLKKHNYSSIEAKDGREAIELFKKHKPDIIFMDVMMPVMDGYDATRIIKGLTEKTFIPIIFLTAMTDEEALGRCIDVGGDDFLVKPYDKFLLRSKIESMRRISKLNKEVQGMYSMIHREQEIGEQVFNNAVQKSNVINDNLRTLIKPATTFSGDMILSAYAPSRDLHFLLGDFTGHGLSAALGALPVSEVFRAMTSKGFNLEDILEGINKKLRTFLPTGMFLGVQLLSISHDLEHVKIINAGMPDLLVIDGETNKVRLNVKSAGLPLGVIDKIDAHEIAQLIPLNHGDKLICNSDGVTEAWSPTGQDYGEDRFLQTIESTPTNEKIFDRVFASLEDFCANAVQADDITLVEINCVHELMPVAELATHKAPHKAFLSRGEWQYSITFSGARLRETNPVPLIINNLLELENISAEQQNLFTVLTELYVNALDHGVLKLNSTLKANPAGFAQYFKEREQRLETLSSGEVNFTLTLKETDYKSDLLIRVIDSGDGFDYKKPKVKSEADGLALCGRGILLIEDLCDSLTYSGNGNTVEAIFSLDG